MKKTARGIRVLNYSEVSKLLIGEVLLSKPFSNLKRLFRNNVPRLIALTVSISYIGMLIRALFRGCYLLS